MSGTDRPVDAEVALDAGLALASELDSVLAQERAALAQRDLAGLTDCVASKDRLLAALARVDATQLLGAGRAGDDQPTFARLADKRARFVQQLAACRDANRLNERLVQRARQAVDGVLATLTGTHRHATYAPDGSGELPAEPRSIGKA